MHFNKSYPLKAIETLKKIVAQRISLSLGLVVFLIVLRIFFAKRIGRDYLIVFTSDFTLYFNGIILILGLAALSFFLFAIGFWLERNYRFMRWLLFSVLGLILCGLFFALYNLNSSMLVPVIINSSLIFVFLILEILIFLIKKKAWVKWVLVILNIIFAASIVTSYFIFRDYIEFVNDWKNTLVVLENKNKDLKVFSQTSPNNKSRYLQTENKYFGVRSYTEIDSSGIKYSDWIIVDSIAALNVKVVAPIATESELLAKIKGGHSCLLSLEYDMNFHENLLFENILNGGVQSSSKYNTCREFFTPERIVFQNSRQISLKDLTIRSALEFKNCSTIRLQNCKFVGEQEVALYCDDDCSDIKIEGCFFSTANTIAVSAPNQKLVLSENVYSKDKKGYDNIMVRKYKFNNDLSGVYTRLMCENGDDMFCEKQKLSSLDNSEQSVFINPLARNFRDVLKTTIKFDFQDIQFQYPLISSLRIFAEDIIPFLKKPSPETESVGGYLPDFTYVNPEFVRWWTENMIPQTEVQIGNYSAKELYEHVFCFDIRLFYECYLHLNTSKKTNQELADGYRILLRKHNRIKRNNKHFVKLEIRFAKKYGFRPHSGFYTLIKNELSKRELSRRSKLSGKLVAFWIRRYIDGSDEALAQLLEKVLQNYDPEYLKYIKKKYKK